MPVEDHPGYARWLAANDALKEATDRLRTASEPEKAAAQLDYYRAQGEYDAAVDALDYGGSEPS